MSPEPDFPDFQLIPDEALNLSPDDEAATFEDPDDAVPEPAESERAPFGRSVYIDWDAGVSYSSQWVSGPDAVVQVLQCALNTVRGTSLLLPDWFGRSGEHLAGRTDSADRRALHEADIRDTLLSAHERVTDVPAFRWQRDASEEWIFFEADVEIDGEVRTLVGSV